MTPKVCQNFQARQTKSWTKGSFFTSRGQTSITDRMDPQRGNSNQKSKRGLEGTLKQGIERKESARESAGDRGILVQTGGNRLGVTHYRSWIGGTDT